MAKERLEAHCTGCGYLFAWTDETGAWVENPSDHPEHEDEDN